LTTPHLSHSEMVGGKILYSLYYFVYFYSITLHLLFCLDNSIVYNISIDVCNNKPCNDIIFSIFFLISIVYTNGFPYPSVQKFAQIHKNGLAKLNKILGVLWPNRVKNVLKDYDANYFSKCFYHHGYHKFSFWTLYYSPMVTTNVISQIIHDDLSNCPPVLVCLHY